MSHRFLVGFLLATLAVLRMAVPRAQADTPRLDLPGSGTDSAQIDYDSLPRIAGEHAVICPGETVLKFQLHNYLIHHDGMFWCMWSQGPPVEDEPSQIVRYATSRDGLTWSEPATLAGPPAEGYAYIARGFWVREGRLLALVAHFKGKGAFGVNKELQLQALSWDADAKRWTPVGPVYDDAINNFAPQRLASGAWMMSRRDSRFNVTMLIGGEKALNDWEAVPVVRRQQVSGFSPDEPVWWPITDQHMIALFRDNGGSQRLFRATSTDQGRTWSVPALSNFPNATSKIYSLKTSQGDRLLFSNANPKVGRRQLHLSLSTDGVKFTRMGLLAIPSPRPATLQYPHAIEHDGHLWLVFSRNKNQSELLKVPLSEIEKLRK